MLTRRQYNKILQLIDTGVSQGEACRRLNLSFTAFRNHHTFKCTFKGELSTYSRMKWTEEKCNELRQFVSNSNGNILMAWEEFANKYNIGIYTAMNQWYKVIKPTSTKNSLVNVGDKTLKNTKNVRRNIPINSKYIQETTEAIKEIHNIPVFDSSVTWKFNYIYKP